MLRSQDELNTWFTTDRNVQWRKASRPTQVSFGGEVKWSNLGKKVYITVAIQKTIQFFHAKNFKQQFVSHSLVSQSFLIDVNLSGKHQWLGFASPYRKQQLQALVLQPAA